ncbi:glycoside hydrolase family 9 protein [Deinococcus cellulosilyticus]|uniref:Endoglucanase n=1 Tax=Deinococcus cellulosilyticus (strain DSM 18568 / NBRC 106333 / KACC 11606 / 5516J-15) TaxID=1223518 RepID=A0A511N0B5_DEIC1|nr:glycoside hydrolase family 9 protein [Deinococcus cellulosilyticus]GEM46292.1 hypothetical protein DC3_19270 [Deinococcus cellulosilyticus NBRC 106333 = KACC 11606]
MSKIRTLSLGLTALLSLGLVACNSTEVQNATHQVLRQADLYTAQVGTTNTWQGGYQAFVRFTNVSGEAAKSFKIKFKLNSAVTLGSVWNGTITGPDAQGYYTATSPDYLLYSPVGAGGTYELGFTANGSFTGAVASVSEVNGKPIGPVDSTPPTTPGTLTSGAVTHDSATLTWTASTDNVGVAKYEVYRGNTLLTSVAGNLTTSKLTGLTPETAYTLKLRAVDAAGNASPYSNTVTFTTTKAPVDTTAPTVPSSLRATDATTTTLTVAWNASTDNVGVSKYEVYLNNVLAGTVGGSTLSYQVTGLTKNTAYSFKVRALDAAGNASAFSTVLTASTLATDPQPVVGQNPCARFPLSKVFTGPSVGTPSTGKFNYGEALQKAILFYEAQQAGPLPTWNRVSWRSDSSMQDAITGGWYDAGDHVKFGFPMAASATLLAWSAIDFKAGYEKVGQSGHIKNNLRFVMDYFLQAHVAPSKLAGQVGNGSIDHAYWAAPETLDTRQAGQRPTYYIDESKPGSDLAGETAAALAAGSMVFKDSDPTYAATLLNHAKQLYAFADQYRGKYSSSITDASGYYNSWSGYQDELVWGAAWLYRATGDTTYLNKAKTEYNNLGKEGQTSYRPYKWTHGWDDKTYGSYVLMYQLTRDPIYQADAERWLDYWTVGFNGEKIRYVGKLAWLDQWGSLRYAANTAMVAMIYSDSISDATKKARYKNFAIDQINYMLGDNPNSRSYVVGFGVNPPKNPHHRGAHGTWADNLQGPPAQSRHTLTGALVGGPDSSGNYTDDRGNYITNEVATDYNAGFTGALARMAQEFGGQSLANFPAVEQPDGPEFFVGTKLNASGDRFTEIAGWATNKSAWPACPTSNVSFRYFVNLSEGFARGFKLSDYVVTIRGGTASGLQLWNSTQNIYFVDVTVPGTIYPGGQQYFRKEVQFRIGLADSINAPAGSWDPTNDPSYAGVTSVMGSEEKPNENVPFFEKGVLVYGKQPAK